MPLRRVGWLFAAALIAASPSAFGEEETPRPHWSVELKGGRFTPDTEKWSQFFHHDSVTYFEAGIGYKLARQLELALNGGYLETTGQGFAPLHGTVAGDVRYELFPVHVAMVWRAVFNEDQWLVPYAGGGWTRIGYRQQIDHQSDISGSADGYHYRGGLQLLLDALDCRSASKSSENSGVKNSYLFLEYQRTAVTKSGVELGGSATLAGVLLEF